MMDQLGEMLRMTTPKGEFHPCKRSGYCCKLTPCQWGIWKGSPKLKACKFLSGENPGQHFCSLYDWIIARPDYDRMFESGCRLSNNPDRKGLDEHIDKVRGDGA